MVTCLKISGAASYDEVKTKLVSSGFCNDYVATYITTRLKPYSASGYEGIIRMSKHSTDTANIFVYTVTINNKNDVPLSPVTLGPIISNGETVCTDYTLRGVNSCKSASYGNVYCVPAFHFDYGFIDGMLITLTGIDTGYQYTVNGKNYFCPWDTERSYRRLLVEWTEPETAV